MPMWNPWRGCRKCSEGCRYCYIHKGDARRGVDTSQIVRTSDFDKPVRQLKKGGYKMKPGLVSGLFNRFSDRRGRPLARRLLEDDPGAARLHIFVSDQAHRALFAVHPGRLGRRL